MAEAALVVIAFFAGMLAAPVYVSIVNWLDKRFSIRELASESKKEQGNGSYPGAYSAGVLSPSEPESIVKSSIDKRRRGIAELRFRAEEASKEPIEHQARITAKNIKAMEG